MRKSSYIWLIVCFLLIGGTSIAQNNKKQISIAKQYVLEKQYSDANIIYLKILKADSTNNEIRYLYARSLYLQHSNTKAYEQFKLLKGIDSINFDYYFFFAQTAMHLEKYKEAISAYSHYIKIGQNHEYRRIAEQQLESSKLALSSIDDYREINIIHLPPPINTEYSEFNAVELSSNKLIFSRYYPQFTDSIENVFSQNYLSDIFLAKQTISGWQNPKLYNKRLSSNRLFTANICFTANKREAYFTKCVDNGGLIGECKIYHSKYINGKWSKAKKLDKVNVDNYTSTQPSIVQFDDYSILYFSSNIPNGFGGSDIWYSIIRNGKLGEIQNAGSIINSKGNEVSPFYDKEISTLFFSSDGHKGFGGFDIFKTAGSLSSFKQIRNMGLGINSPADDLYYIKGIDDDVAYFSSNRIGSYYHGEMEDCCTDIYKAILKPNNEDIEEIIINDSIEIDTNVIAIKKLLPLSLYFENDMPDRKSVSTSTTANYKDLLKDYIATKDIYKKEYAKGLNKANAIKAEEQIEDFFSEKVEHGFSDLNKFVELLKNELTNKKNVRIKIRGYASPLNSSTYNLALSKRRIHSLKNFIREYNNGYFVKYLDNNTDSINNLVIYEDPLGDSQSTGLVSNNPNDKRNSVYSREAALQRKIQIVMYSSNDILPINESSYPILSWQKKEINIGELTMEENKTAIIYFRNTGESELKIKKISSNCNFIKTQSPQTTLQPNEKGKIFILIEGKNLKVNNYSCEISINSNSIKGVNKIKVVFNISE